MADANKEIRGLQTFSSVCFPASLGTRNEINRYKMCAAADEEGGRSKERLGNCSMMARQCEVLLK